MIEKPSEGHAPAPAPGLAMPDPWGVAGLGGLTTVGEPVHHVDAAPHRVLAAIGSQLAETRREYGHRLRAVSLAQSRQWAEVSALARLWSAADPSDAGAPLALGEALEQLGQLADAESAFAAAVALDPDDATGWLRRGLLQARLGRLADARDTLARLTQLDNTLARQLAALPELQ